MTRLPAQPPADGPNGSAPGAESAEIATLVTNGAGIIGEANDASASLLNVPPRLLIGKPLVAFLTRDEYRGFLVHLMAARKGAQGWNTRLVPLFMKPTDVRLSVRPMPAGAGGAVALYWTLQPLRDGALPATMPAPPRPRPDQPASEVEEMRRAFLSAMSHELLTPLAIIQGHAETLRYPAVRQDQAQVNQALGAIRDETVRLRRLVQNVIDSARASAGELRVDPKPSALGPMVTLTVRRFEARSRRHRFVAELPEDLPLVLADLERLESVVYNLLDNALKYSPRGGMIRVRVTPQPTEVEVSVEDEGVGIAAGEETNVFAAYYRAGQALDARAQGSGLGLYLSKAVIDAHGGHIWMASRPEGGTVVRFTLPVA